MSRAPAIITQAIANAPQTQAPPQFNGNDWLAVGNFGIGTAAAMLAIPALIFLLWEQWRFRRLPHRHVVRVFIRICLAALFCFAVRSGGNALANWAWNPDDVATNAWTQTIKGYTDPIAMVVGIYALAQAKLAWSAIIERLLIVPPEPIVVWGKWRDLRRFACIVILMFAASIAAVVIRR